MGELSWSLLTFALMNHANNIAELLIMRGASLENGMDSDPITPLFFAAAHGNLEGVKLLLRHGAKMTNERFFNKTIFDVAKTDAIKKLLKIQWERQSKGLAYEESKSSSGSSVCTIQ